MMRFISIQQIVNWKTRANGNEQPLVQDIKNFMSVIGD